MAHQIHESSFAGLIQRYVNASVLLIAATILALICANLPDVSSTYFELWSKPVSLSIGGFNVFSHGGHPLTLIDFINDFLMFFFFLSVGLEIKREVLCGELSTRQKALLPVIGACGGMIMPVLIFFLICHGNPLAERGCAIPMATDIAFSLGVLSVFGKRVPVGLKIFLAALAVADDLGGIIVIAIFYSQGLAWDYLLGAVAIIAVLLYGNYKGVRSKQFYIPIGLILWYMVLNSGVHATIAGVALAFCIPASLGVGTRYYLEHIRDCVNEYPDIDVTEADRDKPMVLTKEEIQSLRRIESASDKLISPLQDIEDNLYFPINFGVIPFFAFANAGVSFSGLTFGVVALGVMLGLLLGKFFGVLGFSWLSMKLGICQMPSGGNWKSFASVSMVCGIGFTVSMFIAELSFRGHGVAGAEMLDEAKLGILCGTVASAVVGIIMLHFTLPSAAGVKE